MLFPRALPSFRILLSGALLAFCAASVAQDGQPLSTETASHQHYIKTVWVIVMENHNWTGDGARSLSRNPAAPYINYDLLPMASHANRYYNPPHMHPSLPNYLWMEAGTNFGIRTNTSVRADSQTTHEHLVALLGKAGISWKAYDERTGGRDCPVTYWHTPFVFFDDVTSHLDPHSAYCIAHIRPLSEMKRDLAADHVARYNYIVPNLCSDMHNPCATTASSWARTEAAIRNGDDWLRTTVPEILRSTAYRRGGALFIVWDEADRGDGPIPLLVLSPFAKGNGYSNNLHYTHGSLLRTVQEIFGVGPLLRNAAQERDLRDMFTVFP
jgi:hypothetical protein